MLSTRSTLREKKNEGVKENFEIIKLVKSANLKRKLNANMAKKNSYVPKTTTREE